jgi:hypothetical protein
MCPPIDLRTLPPRDQLALLIACSGAEIFAHNPPKEATSAKRLRLKPIGPFEHCENCARAQTKSSDDASASCSLAIYLGPVTLETENVITIRFDDAAVSEARFAMAAPVAVLTNSLRLMRGSPGHPDLLRENRKRPGQRWSYAQPSLSRRAGAGYDFFSF